MRNIRLFFAFLVWVVLSTSAQAQDDLYYDPTSDRRALASRQREQNNVTQRYYDDDYYEDAYDYEYSSRIRRFHRPMRIIDYYDPFYVDMWMYDPFFAPGVSIYVGGFADYWMWRRWMRWRARSWYDPFWGWGWSFSSWGWGWSPWSRPWGWGWSPWVCNNYFYDPYWVWNGFNPYFAPNAWVVNNNYYWWYGNTPSNTPGFTPRTYTGPRRGGTEVSTGYARIVSNTAPSDRIAAPRAGAEIIELKPQRPGGRVETAPAEKLPSDRTGVERPITPPRTGDDNRRPAAPAEPYRPGREATPERPPREATPARPERTDRELRPERPTMPSRPERSPHPEPQRPPRRDDTPSREYSPQRYESPRSNDSRPERPSRGNESSQDRPSRSYDPPSRSYDRPSRDNGFERSGGGSNNRGGGRVAPPPSSGGGSPRGRQ